MSLKKELQTSTGIIKKIKESLMPNSSEMSTLAFQQYETQHQKISSQNIIDNCDVILKALIQIENTNFQEINDKIELEILPKISENINNEEFKYPELKVYIKELQEVYNSAKLNKIEFSEFIKKVFSKKTYIVSGLINTTSNQSAKSRAGHSLENHLEMLFNIMNYEFETQVQVGDDQATLDFIIPSSRKFEQNEEKTMNIECQTTLKDRFRLTLGKIKDKKSRKYLATVTGLNIITNSDNKDITIDKLIEIVVDNSVTLVVFEEIIQKLKSKIDLEKVIISKNPISGKNQSRLLKLDKLINRFDDKIISYSKLVTSEIPNVINMWSVN